jgi:hypothetical protein
MLLAHLVSLTFYISATQGSRHIIYVDINHGGCLLSECSRSSIVVGPKAPYAGHHGLVYALQPTMLCLRRRQIAARSTNSCCTCVCCRTGELCSVTAVAPTYLKVMQHRLQAAELRYVTHANS